MKRTGAFTLLETLVSLALLILACLFLLNLLPSAVIATRATESELIANNLAEAILEETRGRGFHGLTPGVSPLPDLVREGITYHRVLTITVPAGGDPLYVRRVRIDLRWVFSGRERHFHREQLLANAKV